MLICCLSPASPPIFLIVGVDDYNSESDIIIIPSALDFVSQDEMLTPLGRLDKYLTSENIFNRYVWRS